MTLIADLWLSSGHQFAPGKELFQSPRRFQLWAHTVSHSQLLLRSNPQQGDTGERYETTIDVLFKPVRFIELDSAYDGLTIRCAGDEEAHTVAGARGLGSDERVFILDGQGRSGVVIAMAVGWREGVLPMVQPSLFHTPDKFFPAWPSTPLDGVSSGLENASARELIAALSGARPGTRDAVRFAPAVFVLMTGAERRPGLGREIHACGVFLDRASAEEALALVVAEVDECWIESVPIAI